MKKLVLNFKECHLGKYSINMSNLTEGFKNSTGLEDLELNLDSNGFDDNSNHQKLLAQSLIFLQSLRRLKIGFRIKNDRNL